MASKLISSKWNPYLCEYEHEYICDTDSDFANLPKCATGSTAVSIASGKIMVVNTSGEFVTFGG